jgi:transposase-like protein
MDKAAKKIIIRRSEEEKLALIEKWEQSGLPIITFCNQHNFSDSLFHTWLNKYRRNKKKAKPASSFIPIQVPNANAGNENNAAPFAKLTLAKGQQITLYQMVSAEYLRALLS